MRLVVPARLRSTAASGLEEGLAAWVDGALPSAVRAAGAHWRLVLEAPYEPGGSCSWVAPGVDADGREVVLKVGWPHEDSALEADGLRAWGGNGVVRLLDVLDLPSGTRALLLERCDPGTPLGEMLAGDREPEQDVVVAGLLRRLHAVPAPAGLPTLEAMCARWAAGFRRAVAGSGSALPPTIVDAGLDLYAALAGSAPRRVLLATDLHAGNVLAARREPWLVVDPKPHVGDPAYDVTQHLLNCPDRLVADPVGLCARVAGLLGVPADRVTSWIFARAVLEQAGRPFAAGLALRLAPVVGC